MKTFHAWICCLLAGAVVSTLTSVLTADEEAADGFVGAVVELLHDKDKDIRALALEQISTEAKGAAATKTFAKQLHKLSAEAQVGLIRALADRGDAVARPDVLELLKVTKDDAVKVAVLEALGALGEVADLQLLTRSLQSSVPVEAAAAQDSLIRFKGEAVSRMLAVEMKSADAVVRVLLIETLAARRALEAIPELLLMAKDTNPLVRAAAMTALGQIASTEHLPGLIQAVLSAEPGREREAAEKNLVLICNRSEDEAQRTGVFIASLEQLPTADQLAMLSTLGRLGGKSAQRLIEAAIADKQPSVHGVGVRALCNWPTATVAPQLMELARTEENKSLRIAALRALIRVAPLTDNRSDEDRIGLLAQAIRMAERDEERLLALDRARTIRTLDALNFIVPYLDQPAYAEQACLSVVELAHHRTLRQPNKAVFDQVLDQVISTSQDEVVIDRAKRYKKDQTWVRPAK